MIIATNKKANFEYEIIESFQAGLCLSSVLVKEVRGRRIHLLGKYIVYQNDQLQILDFGNDKIKENVTLLLNKKEKKEISGHLSTKGNTCIILNIKAVGRWLKAEVAIAKGKKSYDKRETIKKRDLDREERRLEF
jgi:SsrA-binding protein